MDCSLQRLEKITRHLAAAPCAAGATAGATGSMRLLGKRVLLTGGGSGIGRGIALAFANEGAAVVIGGRRVDALQRTIAELPAGAAGRIVPRRVDIADPDSAAALVAFATEALGGGIDVLINNAGINVPARSLAECSVADWTKVVSVNLNGTFHMIHAVLPQMRARGDGLIINVTSIAGRTATKLAGAAYCASKFGANALGDMVGIEEHANGIRVTNLCPGEVATELVDKRASPPPPATRARMLQPEDVAAAAVMIAALPPRAHAPTVVLTGKTTVERGGVPMW